MGKGNEMEMKVTVAPEMVDAILEKLAKLTKKAEKLGVPPLTLAVSAPYVVKERVRVHDPVADAFAAIEGENSPCATEEVNSVKVDLTLTGEPPKLNGWKLAARLDWIEGEAVVMKVPSVELKKDWSTSKKLCEHCNTVRNRAETFVVLSDSGEEKEVGSDCLKDFLGHNAAAIFSFWTDMIGEVESWGGGAESKYLVTPEYLSWVALAIRTGGWVSGTVAYASNGLKTSSASVAMNMMHDKKLKKEDRPTEADGKVAEAALEWARTELTAKEPKSDYEKNLTLVVKNDYLSPKHVGIAASVIPAFKRALGLAEEKKLEAASEYVGEVKKREVFKGLTVVFVKEFESDYGVTYLIKMKDEKGNVLVWWTGSWYPEVGYKVDLKATVKAHEMYGSVKQTVITRAVVL